MVFDVIKYWILLALLLRYCWTLYAMQWNEMKWFISLWTALHVLIFKSEWARILFVHPLQWITNSIVSARTSSHFFFVCLSLSLLSMWRPITNNVNQKAAYQYFELISVFSYTMHFFQSILWHNSSTHRLLYLFLFSTYCVFCCCFLLRLFKHFKENNNSNHKFHIRLCPPLVGIFRSPALSNYKT